MKQIFIKKCLVIWIIILFFIISIGPITNAQNIELYVNNESNNIIKKNESGNEKVTICIQKYDSQKHRLIKEPIKELTKYEAEKLKNELLKIQETYISSEQIIKEQINLMHKYGLLPSNISYEEFTKVLNNIKDNYIVPSSLPKLNLNVNVYGPSIVSRLAIGGKFVPLHLVLWDFIPPWVSIPYHSEFDIFNGTTLEGWIGVVPVQVIYCPTMTIIVSAGISTGPKIIFSPFVAIDVIFAGISISLDILDDTHPFNVLEWGVGVFFIGLTAYIATAQV